MEVLVKSKYEGVFDLVKPPFTAVLNIARKK
jgi:hypothetical protein